MFYIYPSLFYINIRSAIFSHSAKLDNMTLRNCLSNSINHIKSGH
ncbi:hypothetical protein OMAG_000106 [Candidatus Omnitrophus magneticus]|uniref:Uncharacterized protein n=1 Tax=Candidatus Omnitrophus magneticus TaxID=1609969 RepID=A0A0F0CWR9_9BACT|nr:hypothetical protein OMAG_000106 [Candidatus Omnitrophus magneticus]